MSVYFARLFFVLLFVGLLIDTVDFLDFSNLWSFTARSFVLARFFLRIFFIYFFY